MFVPARFVPARLFAARPGLAGLVLAALGLVSLALFPQTASAQAYGYGPSQTYGQTYGASGYSDYRPCQTGCGYNAPRRHYNSYNGQADVPGDYRCDAYWDASRTDCNAAWRNQRGASRRYNGAAHDRGYGHSSSYGSSSYGSAYGYGGSNGSAVYQGQYGRPDVVYSGGGYRGGYQAGYQGGYQGGAYPDRYGHDHSAYGQNGRNPQRINWCCAEYRSYDPATGYYTAYSGERIFCG